MRLLSVWLVCGAFALYAQQSIDLFTLSGFTSSPASYNQPISGKARESGGLVNFKLPIVLGSKSIWYNDFTYSVYNISTNLSPEPTDQITSLRLHGFIFQTGLVQKLNDRNSFQFLIVPRYTTDFYGGDSRNWQWGAIALYEHRSHERLMMRYGILYNGELFGPLLVPLVYLDWVINDRWSLVGLMPINLKVNYCINDRLTTGFSHFGFITTYRLGQENFKSDYIERNSIDEALFLRWKMIGNLFIETRLGYSLSRIYEQYSEDQKMDLRISLIHIGDNRDVKNVNFNSGPIASLRLVYALSLDKKSEP
jgi:hypothetical protein